MKFLIGTYSQPDEDGEGIYTVDFDTKTGAFGASQLRYKCLNPSWLELSPDRKTLFTVCETSAAGGAAVLSLQMTPTGDLVDLSKIPINGDAPCHLAFDPHHSRLASAQYGSGNIAICGIKAGRLQPPTYFQCAGSGPNAARQTGPHAHCVAFSDNGDVLHVVDLGSDKIISLRLESDQSISATSVLTTPPGAGPRHMVLNKDASCAWVLCELDESLVSLKRDGLGWKIDKSQTSFASTGCSDGAAAAIRLAPNQRHFYISGRHQSHVAGFRFDGAKICDVHSDGLSPRDLLITSDERWVIAANQASNTLTSLSRDPVSGTLIASGYVCRVGSPVSLQEI